MRSSLVATKALSFSPCQSCSSSERNLLGRFFTFVAIIISIIIVAIITIIIIVIIITRPKPAYGRQGLAGSWGQDTDEVSNFLVFLTSLLAPAALSSDLTNLGPLITMKIHLETLKTMKTNQKA